jgi:cytoskeletal protein RodZ
MSTNLELSNSNNILKGLFIILIVVGIAYFIYYLYSHNGSVHQVNKEHFQASYNEAYNEPYSNSEDDSQEVSEESHGLHVTQSMKGKPSGLANPVMNKQMYSNPNSNGGVVGSANMNYFSKDSSDEEERNTTSFPKDQLTAAELLPQDNSSLWAQVNPSGEGSLKDRNFLQSGYHIGINTVGQTLRNANLQLRSEPPCPQVQVSPFLQSTISPDLGRKPFEIGGCM